MASIECPHGAPGTRLWVRETWQQAERFERFTTKGSATPPASGLVYRADAVGWDAVPWRPSILMPRRACRLLLEVTSVRVERLQEISEADALAEGIEAMQFHGYLDAKERNCGLPSGIKMPAPYAREFGRLWDTINGKRASWDSNPWVWVVEFRRLTEADGPFKQELLGTWVDERLAR